jgi:hypothetical protein
MLKKSPEVILAFLAFPASFEWKDDLLLSTGLRIKSVAPSGWLSMK